MSLSDSGRLSALVERVVGGRGKAAVILPTCFFSAMGLGTLSLGMIFYVRDVYRAPASLVGWLAAVWPLCYSIGCLLLRPRFNFLRPRVTILLATLAMGSIVTLILLLPSLVSAFLLYALFGFSTSLFH